MSHFVQSPPRQAAFSELQGVMAVSAHTSFRRAASELGVSASALSHSVASLEQRLGVKLFHRTTRSVSLSEAGQRFVERIGPALREIDQAMETVNDFRDTPTGTLRINTAEAAALRLFEPLVLPFLARYPDMKIDLVSEGRLVDVVAGGFDAGIRLAETVPRDMVSIPCGPPMRFVVVGSPAYLASRPRPRSPADLHAHVCIRRRLPSGAILHWELEKKGKALSIDVAGPLTLDSDRLMLAAVKKGLGLAWIQEWTVEEPLAKGEVVEVLADWSPRFPGLCLYYPPHSHPSAGLRALVAMIRELGLAGGTRRVAGVEKKRRKGR